MLWGPGAVGLRQHRGAAVSCSDESARNVQWAASGIRIVWSLLCERRVG